MPLTNPQPIKLNPTTITIPQSSTGSLYPLKLALTPHLLIEDSFGLPSTIKKDGDAVFEVMVAVGGTIEVEMEVDRDGLEKVGGADMSISKEMELEEVIRDKIVSALRRNTASLAIEEIRSQGNSTAYTIRPLASNADRSHSNSALVPAHQPIAYLGKIGLCLNWCQPSNREKTDSDESQSSNPESQASSQPQVDEEDERQIQVQEIPECGQLPRWGDRQLQLALDQLLRTNLIKRYPLIFDPDLHRHIPSITKSATLLHTLTRALALSASHRTDLYLSARPRLRSLLNEQDRMTKYKLEQVSNLDRRNRSKRIKSDAETSEGSQEDFQYPKSVTAESQPVEVSTQSKEIIVKLLSDAITRIGWAEWKQRRGGKGKLNVRRIKLATEDSDTVINGLAESEGSELNKRMSGLHLDDGERWGAFLDDDPDHAEYETGFEDHVHRSEEYDDDLFLSSDDGGVYDDDADLFDDHEDDLFDSEDEDEQGGRMNGVDVVGYPWSEHVGAEKGDGDDWLDEESSAGACDDEHLLDFDHEDHLLDFDYHQQDQTEHSTDQLLPHDNHQELLHNDEDDDEEDLFDDEEELFEDDTHTAHQPSTPAQHPDEPISLHQTEDIRPRDPDPSLDYANHPPDHHDLIDVDRDLLDNTDDDHLLDNEDDGDLFGDEGYLANIPVPGLNPTREYQDRSIQLPSDYPQFSNTQPYQTDRLPRGINGSELPQEDLEEEKEEFFDEDEEPTTDHSPITPFSPVQHTPPLIHLEPAQYILPQSPQFSLGQAGAMICDNDNDLFESDDDLESELGVYTADQYYDGADESLISSNPRSPSPCSNADMEGEEIVYRIPSLPSIDMRHYGEHNDGKEEEEDEFMLMSDEEDSIPTPLMDDLTTRAGIILDSTIVFMDFERQDYQDRRFGGTSGHDRFSLENDAHLRDAEMVDASAVPARCSESANEEMGEYSEDDLF